MKSNDHFLHYKPFAIACRSPITIKREAEGYLFTVQKLTLRPF